MQTRRPHKKRVWTPADIEHLKWYADRGFSQAEAAKMLERTEPSVAMKASQLSVHFHGESGAPFGNQNGAVSWYRRGET